MRIRAILLSFCALALSRAALAAVPVPTVQGPITTPNSPFFAGTMFDLSEVGYTQEEYFMSGTATAYTNTGPLGVNGLWSVAPSSTAAYKTRFLVHRPSDPKQFNGTVIVEWLNVSGGVDAAPDWTMMHTELTREHYAWVGVSAQYVGVEGGAPLVPGLTVNPLKLIDPARYGSLVHPGDPYSYDIYSQAAQLLSQTGAVNPLHDYKIKRMIAIGESQSAFRMVTYINAIHPLAKLFDGFFVHSRSGGLGAALSEPPLPAIAVPGAARIRPDIDVPVLTFETETDLTFLAYYGARQEDSANFRLWEIAGTSHADTYTVEAGMTDRGKDPAVVGLQIVTAPLGGIFTCDNPFNSGPQHFVAKAAIAALDRWVRNGRAPRSAPRLEASGPPVVYALDANGNARGGIRTPQVDVPIATFTGLQSGSILCALFGSTTPFDAAKLKTLYPTPKSFVSAYNKATNRAVRKGWLRRADAKLIKQWAATANIGG